MNFDNNSKIGNSWSFNFIVTSLNLFADDSAASWSVNFDFPSSFSMAPADRPLSTNFWYAFFPSSILLNWVVVWEANSSWVTKVSANSSLDIPKAFASDFCCITLYSPNSADVPISRDIALANPAWSSIRAALLASSKFNCLPVINSASISAAIELSKSNKESAVLFNWDWFIPNLADS